MTAAAGGPHDGRWNGMDIWPPGRQEQGIGNPTIGCGMSFPGCNWNNLPSDPSVPSCWPPSGHGWCHADKQERPAYPHPPRRGETASPERNAGPCSKWRFPSNFVSNNWGIAFQYYQTVRLQLPIITSPTMSPVVLLLVSPRLSETF